MSRTDTWMPLHIADYFADTRHLSTIEHGAYLLLLMEYWRRGPLPDDDKELAALALVDRKSWAKDIGQTVRRFFCLGDDGLLHQKRADNERARAVDLSDKRRAAANQRGNKMDIKLSSNDEQLHEQMPTHAGVARPLPLPLPLPSESITPQPPRGLRAKALENDPAFAAFYAAYPLHDAPDDALKAWKQVVKAGAKPSDIMAGVAKYPFRSDPQYIKAPAAWLRAGCWKVTAPARRESQTLMSGMI